MLENYTLIIPTFNRPGDLERCLKYLNLKGFNAAIIVADSSRHEFRQRNRAICYHSQFPIKYSEYPESIHPYSKILKSIELVKTPFVSICADDDFVVPNAIEESIAFLQVNPDYTVCHGRYLNLNFLNAQSKLNLCWEYESIGMASESPIERLSEFLTYYEALFYGVFRTRQLYNYFGSAQKVESYLFKELFLGVAPVLEGKCHRLMTVSNIRMARTGPSSAENWHPVLWFLKNSAELLQVYCLYRSEVQNFVENLGVTFPEAKAGEQALDLLHALYFKSSLKEAHLHKQIDEIFGTRTERNFDSKSTSVVTELKLLRPSTREGYTRTAFFHGALSAGDGTQIRAIADDLKLVLQMPSLRDSRPILNLFPRGSPLYFLGLWLALNYPLFARTYAILKSVYGFARSLPGKIRRTPAKARRLAGRVVRFVRKPDLAGRTFELVRTKVRRFAYRHAPQLTARIRKTLTTPPRILIKKFIPIHCVVLLAKILPIRFIGFNLHRVGHLAMEFDAHLKGEKTGLVRRVVKIVLPPIRHEVANRTLLEYWKPHAIFLSDRWLDRISAYAKNSPFFFDTYPYIVALEETSLYAKVQAAWGDRPPLLKVTTQHFVQGNQWLRKMGIKEGDWYVCLHSRGPGYAPNEDQEYRDSDISTFNLAIDEIVARGGWCIRLGDTTMPKLPPRARVVDYAHSEFKSDFLDLFLPATSRFFLGTCSGPASISPLFGVPVVSVNMCPMSHVLSYTAKDIGVPKMIRSVKDSRILCFKEVFDSEIANFRYGFQFRAAGVWPLDNSPEDIRDAVIEMFHRIDKKAQPFSSLAEENALQKTFKSLMREGHYTYGSPSRIGTAFLLKYKAYLLPANERLERPHFTNQLEMIQNDGLN